MENLTKLDAARRNLAEAIRLFFEERDAVAVHTLAAAAQNVLRDIARARGLEHTSILHDNPMIELTKRKAWAKAVNVPRNFFKHGENDPDGNLEFDSGENILTILDAALILTQLDQGLLHEASVFLGWYTTAHPEFRDALSGDVIGDYCVRNKISADDMERFRRLLDTRMLIEPI